MTTNMHPMGTMKRRWITLSILAVMALFVVSLFATSRALAQDALVVTAPSEITVEAEGPDGTPATNAEIAAFLRGATAQFGTDLTVPVTLTAPRVFPLGATLVTFTASITEPITATATADATVTVRSPSGGGYGIRQIK